MKRLWMGLLLLCMVALLLPGQADAAEISGTCGENLTWVLDEAGTLTISGTGDMDRYSQYSVSPWSYSSVRKIVVTEGVTGIGDWAFHRCYNATSVTIAGSVESIGAYAFYNCNALTQLTISDGLRSIGEYAFRACYDLTSVTLPASLVEVEENVFYDCKNLTQLLVDPENPNFSNDSYGVLYNQDKTRLVMAPFGISGSYTVLQGVTEIGSSAFMYCNKITNISLAGSVTQIGKHAFYGCEVLQQINLPDGLTHIGAYAFDSCKSLLSLTIPDSVTTIGEQAFCHCDSLTSLVIPDQVKEIPSYAFASCDNLASVTIGDGATAIGVCAFSNCPKLTSVTLGSGVASFGDGAFSKCSSLQHILVDENNPNFTVGGQGVLLSKDQTRVCLAPNTLSGSYTVPQGVTAIDAKAFSYCSGLNAIVVPDSVVKIGSGAFADTAWYASQPEGMVYAGKVAYKYKGTCPESVVIRDGTVAIADGAFSSCTMKEVTIPDSVRHIGDNAFWHCYSLQRVQLSQNLETIGNGAFADCGLTALTIPDSVQRIGSNAFYSCNLTSLTLGTGLTAVGENAFYACGSLEKVYIPDLFSWCAIDFADLTANPLFGRHTSYSNNKADLYVNGQLLSESKDLVIPQGVTSIGSYAFYDSDMYYVTIPDSVTRIGKAAFAQCNMLNSVYISDIASWCDIEFETPTSNPFSNGAQMVLNGDWDFTELVIPEGVTRIRDYAFYNTGKSQISLPQSLRTIDKNAFLCGYLNRVTISESNSYYCTDSAGALYNKDKTQLIHVPNLLEGSYSIPQSVTELYPGAFYKCTKLTEVTIQERVTNIPDYAFYGCKKLTEIAIPDSVVSIGADAFYDCEKLSVLTLGKGVTSIGEDAFINTALARINISDLASWCEIDIADWSATPMRTETKLYINGRLLYEHLEIPEGVTKIGMYAFKNCTELTSVTIPETVTDIGSNAFSGCKNLLAITIPGGVSKLEYRLSDCTQLKHIFYSGTKAQWQKYAYKPENVTVHYNAPSDSLRYYIDVTGSSLSCKVCREVLSLRVGVHSENGWCKAAGYWLYYQDGQRVTDSWVQDSAGWCYVDAKGICVTDCWKQDSVGWCYLDAEGRMATNRWVQNGAVWYYMDENGYLVTNSWKQDSRGWCYLTADGSMATDRWIADTVGWCYVGSDGYCVTNCWKQDTVGWCYLNDQGRMATNQWIKDSQGWCYVGADGYCVTDQWKQDSIGWCYLDTQGRMVTDGWIPDTVGWCYVGSDGYMVRSQWILNGGKWYYLDGSGYMVTNTWIDGCWIGADGIWYG